MAINISMRKILTYTFFLLFLLILLIIIIDVYITYIDSRPDYICKYIKDKQDYQNKLILAENNSTLLFQLALYNYVCTKDKKEEERLQKKLKKLEELEQNMSK